MPRIKMPVLADNAYRWTIDQKIDQWCDRDAYNVLWDKLTETLEPDLADKILALYVEAQHEYRMATHKTTAQVYRRGLKLYIALFPGVTVKMVEKLTRIRMISGAQRIHVTHEYLESLKVEENE